MKKSLLILVIAGFLLIGLSEIQAQTSQTNLNQTELMKQLIGSWKLDMGGDTTILLWKTRVY
jgi:Ca2+/H+ antiporter